jgi:hypothetical protein
MLHFSAILKLPSQLVPLGLKHETTKKYKKKAATLRFS